MMISTPIPHCETVELKPGSCAMDATSSSSWPRWRCPEPCSPRHASDRSAQTRAAPGMSWVAAMRVSRQRRCVHDQRRPAHTRPERRSQSAKDRFGARSALLPMRSGLPAAPGGRKLDRQRPASGKCRIYVSPARRINHEDPLACALALGAFTSTAFAEPLVLTDVQMDAVTAGQGTTASVNITLNGGFASASIDTAPGSISVSIGVVQSN